MRELNIHYSNRCVYEKLFGHNVDFNFVQAYLDEMRGPTDAARFNVKNTWRLKGMCEGFRSDIGDVQLLMSGIPTGKLFPTIKYEFPKLASAKAVFGNEGYYFTNCSTKAANQCVLKNWTHKFENRSFSENWKYERGADQGTYKPKNGEILYIMFSEVALGGVKDADSDDKCGISRYDRCDSLVFYGLYTNKHDQMQHVLQKARIDVIIPRGPFVRNDKVRKASLNDANLFYYDEIYVQNIAQINPYMLAQVQYFSG